MKKLLLCLFVLFFSGFSFAEAPAYKTISWDKAIEMYKSKKGALFVDVRTPDEVSQGTVSGSINIPLQQIQARFAELPKDKDLLIFCRSGRRSQAASEFLTSQGYTRIYNVDGGFLAAPPAAAFK
ncbi:MAG: rhodanese-like domain-containing protein [Fibrobacter intestinalis]|uniref:Rhodanese-related sulfurtransferase n=1 Tax=Fibrobacter intestinalis TaxID=28122 RepID=A0A1T4P2V7_9BACT|nr:MULTISPECIES: rhodanese-like domain-containing protein [Fibrobacter]PBC74726.1 rhodanese-related sulfurtransferase [Fibrobacter sp. NR9]SJZ85288.1 Rhodanese-related sulfurtransferase [Fibrobacter intestinalis]